MFAGFVKGGFLIGVVCNRRIQNKIYLLKVVLGDQMSGVYSEFNEAFSLVWLHLKSSLYMLLNQLRRKFRYPWINFPVMLLL